jgi:hypothetical protein
MYAACSNAKLEYPLQADTINNKWNKVKAVQQAVSEILKKEHILTKKHWISDDILELIDERRKYKNSQDDFGKRRYRELKNRNNREAIVAKNTWFEKLCNEVEELFKSNKTE